jgi:hypothetical protein
MLAELADPEVYRVAAERVRRRAVRMSDELIALELEPEAFLRRLAREVSTQFYAFGPVMPCRAFIAGKQRTLYRAAPLDDIVLGALARVLAAAFEPALSPHVYSYRRGRSRAGALRAFRRYLRAHRAQHPDPRTRGLYVIRRDIQDYGDSIPCHARSALWPQLVAALQRAGIAPTEPLMEWLRAAFRPPLRRGEWLEVLERGVPTGSPLQPLACNLYLGPLDALCEAVPGAFYARYGDDVLFAHPALEVALQSAERMDDCVSQLGLRLNPDKSGMFYFTQPGRPAHDPRFRGVPAIDHLGVRVDFRGAFGLPRVKQRRLLSDVRARLRATRKLLAASPAAERAPVLGAVARAVLSPRSLLANDVADELARVVDDRSCLRQLDYRLARLMAASLTGDSSPRALRRFPPRRVRRETGLGSLVAARHRKRGGA